MSKLNDPLLSGVAGFYVRKGTVLARADTKVREGEQVIHPKGDRSYTLIFSVLVVRFSFVGI